MLIPSEGTALGGTITASALSVFIINWLKNASWFPLLQKDSKAAARVWALVLSAISALGIHVTLVQGTLTITGLTLTSILIGGWAWLKSFAVQEWIYQSTRRNKGGVVMGVQGLGHAGSDVPIAEPAPKPTPENKP